MPDAPGVRDSIDLSLRRPATLSSTSLMTDLYVKRLADSPAYEAEVKRRAQASKDKRRHADAAELSFEESVVRSILKNVGRRDLIAAFGRRCKERTGIGLILADELVHEFRLPFELATRRVWGLNRLRLRDARPSRRSLGKLAEIYLERHEAWGCRTTNAARPLVLVVGPLGGVRGRAWVLHPADPGYLSASSWIILRSRRRPKLTLVLSDLTDWAACLKKQLTPATLSQAEPRAPTPASAVIRALGDSPAAAILRWLLGCFNPAGLAPAPMRDFKGRRWALTTQGQLAAATGLTKRQVEAGLKTLRECDLVKTEQHRIAGFNAMHVTPADDVPF